jgi:hypothetical protein
VLSIHSTSSNRELRIRRGKGAYFIVELSGHCVSAVTEVWIDDDAASLGCFLTELGDMARPWVGKREWGSLENDIAIGVTCSSLGVVNFNVRISGLPGAPEEWHVTVGVETELGQLSRIGQEAKGLTDESATP